MRIRGLSGRISSKALASIHVHQVGSRIVVTHDFDKLLGSALNSYADDFNAEKVCDGTSRGETVHGFIFKNRGQADEYYGICWWCRELGRWLIQQGRADIR